MSGRKISPSKPFNSLIYLHRTIWVVTILSAILLFTPGAEAAHFVCGQVNSSSDGASPGWRNAMIYYEADRGNYTTCQVSAENDRYCCDAEAIPSHSWVAGDVIFAEIIDDIDGYVSGPFSVITTAEGYDMEPDMVLGYAVSVNITNSTVFADALSLTLNISTLYPYISGINYTFDGSNQTQVCIGCNSSLVNLSNVTEGLHSFIAYAKQLNSSIREKHLAFTVGIEEEPVITPSPESGSSPSSSGGGGGGRIPKRYKINLSEENLSGARQKLEPGKPLIYRDFLPDDPFSSVVYWIDANLSLVVLHKNISKTLPSFILPKGIELYSVSSLWFGSISPDQVRRSQVQFKVPHQWLDQHSLSPDMVYIGKLVGSRVEILDYMHTSDSSFDYYQIDDNSLSIYLIFSSTSRLEHEISLNPVGINKQQENNLVEFVIEFILAFLIILLIGLICIAYYFRHNSFPGFRR